MSMTTQINLGDFTLDTLQIYFPWDDDLYTELKAHGFGSGNFKVLPLIYSDNTEATIGQKDKRRKFVIRPELFGRTYKDLGWTETERRSEPIIPAEKPLANFSIINLDTEPKIKVTIIPTVNNKEHYHLEFSSRSAFGKMYSNWATFYLMPKDILAILDTARQILGTPPLSSWVSITTEKQQAQREQMLYVELPVIYYQFCLKAFGYAVEFFEHNGVDSKNVPSLVYDSTDKGSQEVMSPYIKLGIVHTTEDTGFEVRNPQFVMKIAQDKITLSRRGKRAKVKGKLVYGGDSENYYVVDAHKFIQLSERVIAEFQKGSKQTPLF
jgi:hypothetical protein